MTCTSTFIFYTFNSLNIELIGVPDTIYAGERFILSVAFPGEYPMESPIIVFIGEDIPVHEHVYSNGHICLSVLYDEWSPASTIMTLCLSIQSMLSAAKVKVSTHLCKSVMCVCVETTLR